MSKIIRVKGHALAIPKRAYIGHARSGKCSCGWSAIDCENAREVRSQYRTHQRDEIKAR